LREGKVLLRLKEGKCALFPEQKGRGQGKGSTRGGKKSSRSPVLTKKKFFEGKRDLVSKKKGSWILSSGDYSPTRFEKRTLFSSTKETVGEKHYNRTKEKGGLLVGFFRESRAKNCSLSRKGVGAEKGRRLLFEMGKNGERVDPKRNSAEEGTSLKEEAFFGRGRNRIRQGATIPFIGGKTSPLR